MILRRRSRLQHLTPWRKCLLAEPFEPESSDVCSSVACLWPSRCDALSVLICGWRSFFMPSRPSRTRNSPSNTAACLDDASKWCGFEGSITQQPFRDVARMLRLGQLGRQELVAGFDCQERALRRRWAPFGRRRTSIC